MQPLGNKILVKDIVEQKKSEAGLILTGKDPLKKVEIVAVSEDTETKLSPGDTCLSEYGGVEIEKGLWLCQESILWGKL